jgi:glycosyltransferase involved in cell wall biosynthesis
VLGVWAHRQALAAKRAGVEVHVVVLHRLVPPQSAFRGGPAAASHALAERLRQPLHDTRDGLPVTYVPYISPPRPGFYAYWGAWAAAPLALAVRALRRSFDFELVHAHNAVPAADAVQRTHPRVPLVISVHGGDVLHTARHGIAGARAVSRALRAATLVLANSHGTAELARAYGAARVSVVHLGTDMPRALRSGGERSQEMLAGSRLAGHAAGPPEHPLERLAAELPKPLARAGDPPLPTLVTVGHLVPRKRHADVVRALALLCERHPRLRYLVIGDGPERLALQELARSLGVAERVELAGQLAPREALERGWSCTLFVMPSTEEAFGVAYVEAMAGGVPAIGCRGEPGPEEIASAGGGIELVDAEDVTGLAKRIDELLSDPRRLRALGERAHATVAEQFTWERCAQQTLESYELALR